MQQKKPSSSLVKYAETREDALLLSAASQLSLSEADSDMMKRLVDILAKWRWMVGISTQNQDEDEMAKELVLLAQFIQQNYPILTLDEINLSIDLSLTGKLNVDSKPYNVFSPLYVGRILNAYIDHKRSVYNKTYENKLLAESKQPPKEVTPEEKMKSMVELVEYLYRQYKEKGVMNDHLNVMYNFLRRTNKLKPPKELVDEAMEYGKRMAKEQRENMFVKVLLSEKPNKENVEKRYARNYCVQKYFDKLPLEEIIKSINLQDFQ